MAAINFLSADGYINVEEFTALAREIDKEAIKLGLKPCMIHYAGKVMPKFDKVKQKANPDLFTRKRAQIIKERTRMPAAGSRMKMVIVLREYKGFEDNEEFKGFIADINAAKKAIVAHNKLAERTVASIKKEGAKKRDALNAAFDKNLDCFIEDVLKVDGEFIDGVDAAVGTSMMGKTLIIKLPNGGYVSVGKADKERFLKAQESEDNPAPAKKAVGRAAPKSKRVADEEETPVRRTKKAAPASRKASTGSLREKKAAAPKAKSGSRSAAMKPALKQKPAAKKSRLSR